MIDIDSFLTRGGKSARLPAAYVYARSWADHLGYGPEIIGGGAQWEWPGRIESRRAAPYVAHVRATNVCAKVVTSRATMSVYFPEPGQIHCDMRGDPFSDDDLLALIAAVRYLPYSTEVGHAIITRADWLDLNPQFRGLKIAQSRNKKVHVDDIGMEHPTFAGFSEEEERALEPETARTVL